MQYYQLQYSMKVLISIKQKMHLFYQVQLIQENIYKEEVEYYEKKKISEKLPISMISL